jgi:hypothetical protein
MNEKSIIEYANAVRVKLEAGLIIEKTHKNYSHHLKVP